jgi:hypothetical protein
MGNSLNFNNETKEYLPSIKYFENTNWVAPDILHLELYEILVCRDIRNYNYYTIKEIFIPEYNLSLNTVSSGIHKYNIIINSSLRYNKKEKLFNDDWKPPKLLKRVCLTKESNPDELEELFDLISAYTKSQNMDSTIKKLFEQIEK